MTDWGDLSNKLAARALTLCRHYLPSGRRQGNYWVVGDVRNTPGRSMYVRLFPDSSGRPAGRWTDAATGEHGDLLDIVHQAVPSGRFIDAVDEAEAFLCNLPAQSRPRFRADRPGRSSHERQAKALFNGSGGLIGTLGADYLATRAIDPCVATGLRFHPNCYCKPSANNPEDAWPALIVPVTDANANLEGIHRIYLDPRGNIDYRLGKAPIDSPKRSLGRVHGSAARFGEPASQIVLAEGIENALSIRTAFPDWTVHAALTAGNLATYSPLAITDRLLIALDDDEAGRWAAQALIDRLHARRLSITWLHPITGDHNATLRALGLDRYRAHIFSELAASRPW